MSGNELSDSRSIMVWLRNKLLTGLALIIPLVLTFWILRFFYRFLLDLSTPLLLWMGALYNSTMPEALGINLQGNGFILLNQFIGFLVPLVLLVVLGVMATNVLGVRLVAAMDQLLLRVPIISFIYKSLKQVIESFRGFGDTRNFKRVVYVSYPATGMRLIGFVTGAFIDETTGQSMTLVFIPGALSPMTGLLIVAESDQLEDAPLSLEEAMKIIFSGGLIGPDSKEQKAVEPIRTWGKKRKNTPDYADLPRGDDDL